MTESIARADRIAHAAIRSLRSSLRSGVSLVALLQRVELVLERLEEAEVHLTLAREAKNPSRADAHAALAQSLAEEALARAEERSHAQVATPPACVEAPPAPVTTRRSPPRASQMELAPAPQ